MRITALLGTGACTYGYNKFSPINVVWDLDHTLVHTIKVGETKPICQPDFVMTFDWRKREIHRNVYVRFGAYELIKFLSFFSNKQFVFTAAVRPYADSLISGLQIGNIITKSLARDDVIVDDDVIISYFFKMLKKDMDSYEKNGDLTDLKTWNSEELIELLVTHKKDIDSPEVRKAVIKNISESGFSTSWKQVKTMAYNGKDTTMFATDMRRTILIDDKPSANINSESTGLLIPKFVVDPDRENNNDYKLLGIAWILVKCMFSDNIEKTIAKSKYTLIKDT